MLNSVAQQAVVETHNETVCVDFFTSCYLQGSANWGKLACTLKVDMAESMMSSKKDRYESLPVQVFERCVLSFNQ